jgi:uncharacterized membrane protein (DUF2068 family)
VDPGNQLLAKLLRPLSLIEDPQLAKLSAASVGYAALFLVEGTGLYLELRWAEYLTVIATGSFLPLEIYQLIRKVSFIGICILVINIAIMIFLIITIRNKSSSRHRA